MASSDSERFNRQYMLRSPEELRIQRIFLKQNTESLRYGFGVLKVAIGSLSSSEPAQLSENKEKPQALLVTRKQVIFLHDTTDYSCPARSKSLGLHSKPDWSSRMLVPVQRRLWLFQERKLAGTLG